MYKKRSTKQKNFRYKLFFLKTLLLFSGGIFGKKDLTAHAVKPLKKIAGVKSGSKKKCTRKLISHVRKSTKHTPPKVQQAKTKQTGSKAFALGAPLYKARMSSPFGWRHHPVLKKRKLHKGMDFAAKKGEPIKAAASGVVVRAQRAGGYGNYVMIRHENGYVTAYAHLSGYHENIKAGVRVRKGQTIGYVGSTGRSTGPHLHFELIRNGKHINPKNFLAT